MSLFLIWLGGFATGFTLAIILIPPHPEPIRVKVSDLYPGDHEND